MRQPDTFGTRLLQSIAVATLAGLVVWLTMRDSHAQTSIEVFPPWSGSYITNTWLVPVAPGKPGIAAVPSRHLLMTGQNQVVGELANKADAVAALYGPDLIAALRSFMAATAAGPPPAATINALRLTGGPLLTNIDAALK